MTLKYRIHLVVLLEQEDHIFVEVLVDEQLLRGHPQRRYSTDSNLVHL